MEDTVEHTVFVCERWNAERDLWIRALRRDLTPGDDQEILCGPDSDRLPEDSRLRMRLQDESRRQAEAFVDMVERILLIKEEDERDAEKEIRVNT